MFRRVALSRAPTSACHLPTTARDPPRSSTPPAARVAALMGDDFLQHAREVQADAGILRLAGLRRCRLFARASRDAQYFFVNGRFVRDKLLAHAVREVCTPTSCTARAIRLYVFSSSSTRRGG